MNELISGGIYLTKNDNYLVIVCCDEIDSEPIGFYELAYFDKNDFTQYELQTKTSVPQEHYKKFYIDFDDEDFMLYFNNGYCGMVTDKLHNQLIEECDDLSDAIYLNSREI